MSSRARFANLATVALVSVVLHGSSLSQALPTFGSSGVDALVQTSVRHVPALVISPLVSTSTILRADWKTFGNGPSHTGYYPDVLTTASFAPGWTGTLSDNLQQVAVAEGRVFATASQYLGDFWLAALDEGDGHTLWSYTFPECHSINPPTFDGGHVYVQRGNHGSDTQLWSFHADTGVPHWVAPHSAQWERYLAPTVADGKVWVNGGYFGGMYGFQQSDGQQLFFYSSLPQYDQWTPTYYAGRIHSWVAGVLRQHDPLTAAQQWSVDLGWSWAGWSMRRTSAIANGRAFVVGNPNLNAIDLSSHTTAWTVAGTFSGTPAVANGVVYAISGGFVKAYDAWNGAYIGVYVGEPNIQDQPIVTDDVVIFATPTKTFVYDRSTFVPVTMINLGGRLSLANGRLYVATSTGTVRTFDVAGTATPQANLVGDLEPWTTVTLGGSTLRACQVSITNYGSLPSLPCRIDLRLSSDTVLDASDLLLRSVSFGPVAVGERLSATAYLPSDPGLTNKHLLLVPDVTAVVTETNENNVTPSGRIP